ncbi:hypothetical protein, partial [Leyella lascolaii]|uniref:hypothetical protein n=1 Tax=Leyella lascolaii TaxID=1776379 RepID=UPI0023571372
GSAVSRQVKPAFPARMLLSTCNIFAEDMLRFGSIPSGKASFPCQDVALNLQYLCKRYAAAPDYPIARCRRGTSSRTHRCGGRTARKLRTKQYKTL